MEPDGRRQDTTMCCSVVDTLVDENTVSSVTNIRVDERWCCGLPGSMPGMCATVASFSTHHKSVV